MRCWFEKLIPTQFEGISLMGMKNYDEYLSYKYGNYMELPPVEKRKVHPVSKLTLLSWEEEKNGLY